MHQAVEGRGGEGGVSGSFVRRMDEQEAISRNEMEILPVETLGGGWWACWPVGGGIRNDDDRLS